MRFFFCDWMFMTLFKKKKGCINEESEDRYYTNLFRM